MRVAWDKTGERLYETGVDRGVVYPQVDASYPKGAAWNGLTNVTKSPSGAEATPLYANNHKYLNLMSVEELGGKIEAYTYPEEFGECDGSVAISPGVRIGQQKRKTFGLAYRTLLGNDVDGIAYGYKLHLIYGALASPSEESSDTVNDSPEAKTMSWEFSTTPVEIPDYDPTSCIDIDSTTVDETALKKLEDILYGKDPAVLDSEPEDWSTNYKNYFTKSGSEFVPVGDNEGSAPEWQAATYYGGGEDARLPMPDEVVEIFKTKTK